MSDESTEHPTVEAPIAETVAETVAKTAPLKPPPADTAPTAVAEPVADLAATAPLQAPKPIPVEPDLNATAPLAAPKPVPVPVATPEPVVEEPDAKKPSLYFRRTKNFPKWVSVEPTAHGEFAIEFEIRDSEERRLEVAIVDKLELLEVRTWVNRGKREDARKKRLMAAVGAGSLASVAMYLAYPPILPLTIVATLAAVAGVILQNDEANEPPATELVITPEDLTVVRRDEFKLRASPRDARWYLQDDTDLWLATDREARVLDLSREARMQADWFWIYIEARCQEIGSRRELPESERPVHPSELDTAQVPLQK